MTEAQLKEFNEGVEQHVASIRNSTHSVIGKLYETALDRLELVQDVKITAAEALPSIQEANQNCVIHIVNIGLAILALESLFTGTVIGLQDAEWKRRVQVLGSGYMATSYDLLAKAAEKAKLIAITMQSLAVIK